MATFLGEMSYYSQGKSLMCACSKNLYIALSENQDNQVHILNTFTKDKKKFSLSSLKFRKEDKWGNYVKGIFYNLMEMGVQLKTYDITIDGPALKNGNSNLAAIISVGICFALRKLLGFTLTDNEMGLLCYRSCTQYCGEIPKYGVIMAAISAKEGSFLLFDMNNLTFTYLDNPFDNNICSFLVVDCHFPQTAMREELAHRHAEAREAFTKLKSAAPRGSIKDFPLEDLTERVIPLDEDTRRICKVVIEDGLAAQSMQRLFPAHDYVQMGKTFSRISVLYRDDLGFSCPELDWFVRRAQEIPGCYGATGVLCGDNSQVGVLIEKGAIEQLNSKLEDYERIFGFKGTVMEISPKGPCRSME